MTTRRALARRLERVRGFTQPIEEREQYATDAEVAATLVHEAGLRSDLERVVVDLGSGTGMLAIAAAERGAEVVLGVEIEPGAVSIARRNARRLGVEVEWLIGDVSQAPLCPSKPVTVVMNPPFGAHHDARGADRPFLALASRIAAVSYSIHNAASHEFVTSFAADNGGQLTHAYRVELDLPNQFAHHDEEVRPISVEAYRIEWARD